LSETVKAPAARIETDRLVIRCLEPGDAPLLKHAVDSCLEYLREWLPWANEWRSELDAVEERVELFHKVFDSREAFVYGIFSPDESAVVGGSSLELTIGPNALEISYWIRLDQRGQGFATEVARALTIAGFAVPDIERIQIHCDSRNTASCRIPEKLGYPLTETRIGEKSGPGGKPQDTAVYVLTAEQFAAEWGS
jgi:ribosomal-protein-serine acetyltransferase